MNLALGKPTQSFRDNIYAFQPRKKKSKASKGGDLQQDSILSMGSVKKEMLTPVGETIQLKMQDMKLVDAMKTTK